MHGNRYGNAGSASDPSLDRPTAVGRVTATAALAPRVMRKAVDVGAPAGEPAAPAADPFAVHLLDVSSPGDREEREADSAADAMVSGRAARVSSAGGVARAIQRKVDDAPPADAPSTLDDQVKSRLLAGTYAASPPALVVEEQTKKVNGVDRKVKVYTKFVDPDLEAVRLYFVAKAGAADANPMQTGLSGDSEAASIDEHPPWVGKCELWLSTQTPIVKGYDRKAAAPVKGYTQWSDESEVLQALLKAYLLSWTKATLADQGRPAAGGVPDNLDEMYGRVGDSRFNDRARLIGGDPGGPAWCGPASQNSVALALMKHGMRFQGATKAVLDESKLYKMPPNPTAQQQAARDKYVKELTAMTFRQEVTMQGALLLTKWLHRADKAGSHDKAPEPGSDDYRGGGGKAVETERLNSGDVIYLVGKKSPLSGHVATIIKEEWLYDQPIDRDKTPPGTVLSKIYYVSGNAGPVAGGAVRVEQVLRELPPKNYNYLQTAGFGNEYDQTRDAVGMLQAKADGECIEPMYTIFLGNCMGPNHAMVPRVPGNAYRQFFDAHWMDEGAMAPYLLGRKDEYHSLLVKYQTEYAAQIAAKQAVSDAYAKNKEAQGLPYSKNAKTYGTLNSAGNTAAADRSHARDQMAQIFQLWYATKGKNRFKDFNEARAFFKDHQDDGDAMAELMGEPEGAKYKDALERARTPDTTSTPAPAPDASAPAQPAAPAPQAPPPPETGNFSPTLDGHIWVTAIMATGNITKLSHDPLVAAAQPDAPPGAPQTADDVERLLATRHRADVLAEHGLQELGGTIDSLWPGAMEYWESLKAFS